MHLITMVFLMAGKDYVILCKSERRSIQIRSSGACIMHLRLTRLSTAPRRFQQNGIAIIDEETARLASYRPLHILIGTCRTDGMAGQGILRPARSVEA
jgi:hypothetical protein